MTTWTPFTFESKASPTSNDAVSGGKFIGIGEQLVKITSVEPGTTVNGDPFLKMTYSNSSDQIIIDRLYPVFNDKESGKKTPSYKYTSLAYALLPEDSVLRYKMFTSSGAVIPTAPQNWEKLLGLSAVINVQQGRSGVTIEDDEGVYKLYDIGSKSYLRLAGGIPNEFDSYKSAREVIVSQGLRRAWNEIGKFTKADDFVESNQQVIKDIVESAEAVSL